VRQKAIDNDLIAADANLTDEEIETVSQKIIDNVVKTTGGELRG